MTSGIPAFNDMPHDLELALKICQGLRPELVGVPKIFDDKDVQKKYEDTEAEYIELMKKCWDSNPDKRPKAEKLYENFRKWFGIIPNCKLTSIPENETFIKNHPSSYYTSRKIDYAEKLNEILVQEESLESCRIF
ncbi:unnamed protein product [Rhizophagus irregularis]|nr:unnamed protein product [Rhizophagus irregularis]